MSEIKHQKYTHDVDTFIICTHSSYAHTHHVHTLTMCTHSPCAHTHHVHTLTMCTHTSCGHTTGAELGGLKPPNFERGGGYILGKKP